MPKTPELKPINISQRIPAYISDGHQIFVNDVTGETSIMFFQTFPPLERDKFAEAVTVANVRLPLEAVKGLIQSLDYAIKQYEARQGKGNKAA